MRCKKPTPGEATQPPNRPPGRVGGGPRAESRDPLADLALVVPVLPDAVAREDRQPVAHVHAVDLPHELARQRLSLLEGLEVLVGVRVKGEG